MNISPEAEGKRKLLYSPSADFNFQDTDGLHYEEVRLSCVDTNPEETEVGPPIPTYVFDVIVDGQSVGGIELRVGYSIEYYVVGQVGYAIDEPFRGHGYSTKACFALIPMLKKHGFKRIVVTTDENNIASRRSCEKFGASFIETIDTPEWSVLYDEGQRRTSIYEWILEKDIVIEEHSLTADEFVLFSHKMGETDGMTKEQAEKSIANHRCCIAALMCDEIVGIGRLVGDNAIYWCLVDIWVLPEYQGKGIGKGIVNRLVQYAKDNSIPGTSISVFLMAAKGKEGFYEKCGFLRRPHDWEGAGMEMEIDLE